MANELNDRLTFWRGWYDGARRYPDAQRLAVYDAILAFAFDGQEPAEPDGDLTAAIVYQTIATIRPTIEISRKRREFGSAGGRSKAEAHAKQTQSKAQAKRKQNPSKAEAHAKQTRKTANQVKEQEQVQEQEQEHIANSSTTAHTRRESPPSLNRVIASLATANVPEDFIRTAYAALKAVDFLDGDGLYVTNPMRYIWAQYRREKNSAAARESSSGDGLDAYKIGR